jgi:diguanylate cyclase (GGDEF)-like protein
LPDARTLGRARDPRPAHAPRESSPRRVWRRNRAFGQRPGASPPRVATLLPIGLAAEQDEVKGFARTIAEIEWLLLILVLIYLVAGAPSVAGGVAIHMALFFFGAFILALHYVGFYRQESKARLAAETWVMIVFVTWVVWHADGIRSPLLNLYLLPIIASALILGKAMTLLETLAVAACFLVLSWKQMRYPPSALAYWGELLALLGPVILVAYITTMLSADIRYAVEKIKQVSDTDDLTGLYNMRAFTMIFQRTFKQAVRYSHPMSIAMVDSDNLKAVNDTYGHDAGNRLLQHLVNRIREELRGSDVVARYGGDEFIVLLVETGTAGAVETAERIRRAVEHSRFEFGGHTITGTVSIGLASYPRDGGDANTIMEKADRALYRAKQTGKNRVTAYSDEHQ